MTTINIHGTDVKEGGFKVTTRVGRMIDKESAEHKQHIMQAVLEPDDGSPEIEIIKVEIPFLPVEAHEVEQLHKELDKFVNAMMLIMCGAPDHG